MYSAETHHNAANALLEQTEPTMPVTQASAIFEAAQVHATLAVAAELKALRESLKPKVQVR